MKQYLERNGDYPGVRLVTHVPKPGEEPSPDNVYGLELRRT